MFAKLFIVLVVSLVIFFYPPTQGYAVPFFILATAIVWAVGVKIFEHTSSFDELLRTLGFAWAPQLLLVLGILPLGPLAALVWTAVLVLVLAAFVIAARQALDVTTGRALLICALGVVPAVIFGTLFVGATLL